MYALRWFVKLYFSSTRLFRRSCPRNWLTASFRTSGPEFALCCGQLAPVKGAGQSAAKFAGVAGEMGSVNPACPAAAFAANKFVSAVAQLEGMRQLW